MNQITIRGLKKSFGGHLAIQGIDLALDRGEIIAIVGPNGAGKTTLFDLLSGFVRPDAGQIEIDGFEISAMRPEQIAQRGVARAFQDLRLISRLSARENVLLARHHAIGEGLLAPLRPLTVRRESKRERNHAERALERVGLSLQADQMVGSLSFGQQKLLTLACCLARDTARVYLLDEPVAGVHPEIASRIAEVLFALRDQAALVLLIEHEMDLVRRVANRVLALDRGRVLAFGTTDSVLADGAVEASLLGRGVLP